MFRNYFKVAFRNLLRSKAHSFINIAGLSVGMAVAVIIGLWIWDELSFDKNFDHYKRIAQVMQTETHNAALSWWIFAAAGLGALLITLLTVSYQSIRAALMNPTKSLRSE
jgi:putative ABC transport system permease protein